MPSDMERRMQRIKIGTRIHLNYIEFSKSKNDRVSVYFRNPLCEKDAAANAVLMPLLLNGSAKYPDVTAISEKLQDLYGASLHDTNVKHGQEQIIGLSISFLNSRFTLGGEDNLSDCVALLGELLLNPVTENGVFSDEYVKIERNNLITEIKAEINDKGSYARRKCTEFLCGEDTFKTDINGTIETANSLTPSSVYENYLRIISCSPIEVFYAGTEKAERVVECLKLHLGFPRGEVRPVDAATKIAAKSEPAVVTEQMNVVQGKLSMGFTTDITAADESYSAMSIFCTMYGVIPTSKLFMNVREKLSLCYYCNCSYLSPKGIMIVNAGIETDKKQMAQDEILGQLEEMKQGNFTDEEMEFARQALVNAFTSVDDSSGELIGWWLRQICSGTEVSPAQAIERYMAVTREDVIRAGANVKLGSVFFLAGNAKEEK